MIIAAIFFTFVVMGMGAAWLQELKEWNGGICSKTGNPWKYFDTTSQGCRGYQSGSFYVWISYPFVDKKSG